MRLITNLKTNSLLIIKVAENSNFMDVQGSLIKCMAILTSKISVFLIDTDYEIPVIYSILLVLTESMHGNFTHQIAFVKSRHKH